MDRTGRSIRGGSKWATQLEKRSSTWRAASPGSKRRGCDSERLRLDSQLGDYGASGRHKLAAAVTKNVLRIPGAKAAARGTRPKE
ncbi:MAG: hypothetical protein AVDCRST_MAG58-4260 [uncultured Rubrobacteraceae bacterium]|uniref:Uncharacterized protein n=1 Tax=uncultured Rubrobacteraceae bacterium TaxID=349277 RepID=A0A6J4RKV8_9ACTN|nr:MAG: hypothetical protein AVDCRST_MAG58-4260 [uncultured Rubrobacteraceae bacterium]